MGVGSVAVEADLSVAENQPALDRWPTLSEDLRAAISETVAPAAKPGGLEVTVRLISFSVDGSYQLGDDGRFNTMEGVVVVKHPGKPGTAEGMPIKLMATSDTAVAVSGPGIFLVVPPNSDDFYSAMITAFAVHVANMVEDYDR
jgi:hypothetical protein